VGLDELDLQLDRPEADALRGVLLELGHRSEATLGDDLVGLYVVGSFALGGGDVHADVDFVVVTAGELSHEQEAAVRRTHRDLPDLASHWAHNVEGSYAPVGDISAPADPARPWLYVDNGNREMEWSAHDNTAVLRWVLHHRGLAVAGPSAATIAPAVPARVLRDEVAAEVLRRHDAVRADPGLLANAWGQPYVVLSWCRMLYTATVGEVAAKHEAAAWARDRLPEEWRPLIERAIADRPDPWLRVHRDADPALASRTAEFVDALTPLVEQVARDPGFSG
jgi:hypothetical protein